MLRNRIKIEEKTLQFVFEILKVQFNQLGQYRLTLTVENPLLAGSASGVQLRVKDEELIQANSVSTDTIEQTHLEEVYAFSISKFVFTLPEGRKSCHFCRPVNMYMYEIMSIFLGAIVIHHDPYQDKLTDHQISIKIYDDFFYPSFVRLLQE